MFNPIAIGVCTHAVGVAVKHFNLHGVRNTPKELRRRFLRFPICLIGSSLLADYGVAMRMERVRNTRLIS